MTHNNYEGCDLKGTILRLERSSIYDGDGYRTVVFMKGCPLRCQWCSTPESQNYIIEEAEGNQYGKIMTVEEVLREVRKDIPFYFHSGGGMTVSGGELLSQPEYVRCLLTRARWEAIDTAVETSLYGSWKTAEPILQASNTVFADLKLTDDEKHRKYCGVSNKLILENLKKAGTIKADYKLIIRTPLIPGINDTEAELESIGRFCAQLTNLQYVQLLPYHRLGSDTYRRLGRPYPLKNLRSPSAEHMDWCRNIIGKYVKALV